MTSRSEATSRPEMTPLPDEAPEPDLARGPRRTEEAALDVLVIGGGISGLGAAWRLRLAAPRLSITVVEAADACGGKLVTEHVNGYTVEHGPDIFLARKPWALELCRELGLEGEIVPTNPAHRGSFVQKGGRLYPLPQGMSGLVPSRLWPLFATRLLSPVGKLRLAMEWLVPRRRGRTDEPLGQFIRRRLGREMHERIVGPLLGGIYGGDVDRLSLRATFPQLHELEAVHGSLLRGMRTAHRTAARKDFAPGDPAFVTLRGGMQTLPGALLAHLTSGENPVTVLTNCRAESVHIDNRPQRSKVDRVDNPASTELASADPASADPASTDSASTEPGDHRGGAVWRVGTRAPQQAGQVVSAPVRSFRARSVIITAPAYAAADMLEGPDSKDRKSVTAASALAEELRGIEYNSAVVVTVGLRRQDIAHPLDGYGYLVPEIEGKAVRACTWSSSKIEGRAAKGRVLLRFYFGRSAEDPLLRASEKELLSHVACELVDVLGAAPGAAARPDLVRVRRWLRSQPAYTMGHPERLERMDRLVQQLPGLVLTGSAYRGVGIPDVIRQAGDAAHTVLARLERNN